MNPDEQSLEVQIGIDESERSDSPSTIYVDTCRECRSLRTGFRCSHSSGPIHSETYVPQADLAQAREENKGLKEAIYKQELDLTAAREENERLRGERDSARRAFAAYRRAHQAALAGRGRDESEPIQGDQA